MKLELDKILEIVNNANPLGLYESDELNRDEFITESKEIQKRLGQINKSDIDLEKCKKITEEVFANAFEGVEIKKDELDEISENLFKICF